MSKKEKLFWILCFLPIVITAIAMLFMPDRVPMHYGMNGTIDRWGSKYENFIFAIFTPLMGLFFKGCAYYLKKSANDDKKKKEAESNMIVLNFLSIWVLFIFNIISLITLYLAYSKAKSISASVSVDLQKITTMLSGILFIMAGNYMPKCKNNGLIGVRTAWSMKNDKAWALSQRYGGISFAIAGLIIIAGACFLNGIAATIYLTAVTAILLVVCIYLTYAAYKKSLADNE